MNSAWDPLTDHFLAETSFSTRKKKKKKKKKRKKNKDIGEETLSKHLLSVKHFLKTSLLSRKYIGLNKKTKTKTKKPTKKRE